MKTIDLTPSWKTAATIYATALRDGTTKGQEMAYEEIVKMGSLIDDLQQQLKQLQDISDIQGDTYARWPMTDLKKAMGMENIPMGRLSIRVTTGGRTGTLAGNAEIEMGTDL